MPCSAHATVLRRLRTSVSIASAFSGDISGESLPLCAMPLLLPKPYSRPASPRRQSEKRRLRSPARPRSSRAAAGRQRPGVADLPEPHALRLAARRGKQAPHRVTHRLLTQTKRIPVHRQQVTGAALLEHPPHLLGVGVI